MRRAPLAFAIGVVLIAGVAAAQQLYRWTDQQGRVHVTDTPPPTSARDVQKKKAESGGPAPAAATPFEVAQAAKNFPVKLYTSPTCQEPCAKARDFLNKRGVPFSEVQVWDQASNDELKKLVGTNEVPALVVGRTPQKGFQEEAYDALLDSAGYPKGGTVPARAQAAPPPPADYVPASAQPKAEPAPAAQPEAPAPLGPYSPGAPPQRSQKRQ